MSKHVIKYEFDDGIKLQKPVLWCGREAKSHERYFADAQHVALAAGGSIEPCKACIKAIIKALSSELD